MVGELIRADHLAEDELGATQQGLDKSGVRMPNFAGLNKAMDRHEPVVETPEQREFSSLFTSREVEF